MRTWRRSRSHADGTFVTDSLYSGGAVYHGGLFLSSNSLVRIIAGSGSPEGVLTAGVGSIYQRTDGGAGTSIYVKESGSGMTGWVAK